MATKKKAQPKTKTVFILHNGTKYDVTGEDGKYIYCGTTQFRKSANRGTIAVEETKPEPEKEPEPSEE